MTLPSVAELKRFRELAANKGPVMFIGMGASYCSSFGGSVFLQTHGHSSFTADAGEWLNYASSIWDDAVCFDSAHYLGRERGVGGILQAGRGIGRLACIW